ncbi:hypothetical protein AB0I34_30430 [Kribbella sp. NPDC050281]|uniref:hypothetical protein n=1 Tax=Kribbella sp. NPDC050281 TaxID=3155515 RepID=UPI0033FCD2DC
MSFFTRRSRQASREHATEVLHRERHFGRKCDQEEARDCLRDREAWREVDVLLAAGVFRDEAEVKAKAPEREADGAIGTVRGPFGLPFAAVSVGHVLARAAAIRSGAVLNLMGGAK